MSVVIVQLNWVDPASHDETIIIGVREIPFPGDTIRLAGGRRVRVLRREYNELHDGKTNMVDAVLGVRNA